MNGKIHILFSFKSGPYGGGNQFLKALREEWKKIGCYTDNSETADIFLFNSFQDIRTVLQTKRRFPKKHFVHRVDGPISLYRNSSSDSVDRFIFSANAAIADATLFQSQFSLRKNRAFGMSEKKFEAVIFNAPDSSVFFPSKTPSPPGQHRKTRLISTSWSSNPMKGFDAYAYLDTHLDFSKYEYTFVGNSPIAFKHIQKLPPKTSQEIASLLRASDIFITASRKDPCSNSLIEALTCKLPAIALNDGGHPELIQKGGETFVNFSEIPTLIELVSQDYLRYKNHIPDFDIKKISEDYRSFLEMVRSEATPKKINALNALGIFAQSWIF